MGNPIPLRLAYYLAERYELSTIIQIALDRLPS